jgi:predicted transglutaminase-like protease
MVISSSSHTLRLTPIETKNWSIAVWAACMKKNEFFSIFFKNFIQVNYIFHKLSVNTKYVQFRLYMSPWQIFVENGYQAHYSCIFYGAPTSSHVAETAEGLKGKVLKK